MRVCVRVCFRVCMCVCARAGACVRVRVRARINLMYELLEGGVTARRARAAQVGRMIWVRALHTHALLGEDLTSHVSSLARGTLDTPKPYPSTL